MAKSTRCGACGKPIKGHSRRAAKSNGKDLVVVLKIRKNGRRRP